MPKKTTFFAALAPLLIGTAASAQQSVTLQFDSARYRLGEQELEILEHFWSQLPADRLEQLRFQVEGRADPMGRIEDNRELAARRAQSVGGWLSRRGIADTAIARTAGIASQAGSECPATLPRANRITCLAPARRVTISVTAPPEPKPQPEPVAVEKPPAPEPKEQRVEKLVKTERASPPETLQRELYLALDLYQATADRSRGDFANAMARDGVDIAISDYDVERPAWQLALGYRYHPRMAVEIGYLDLGEASFAFDARAPDTTTFTSALDNNLPTGGSGWSLANRFDLPLGRWRASATAGLYFWRDDPDLGDAAIDPGSRSGTDPLIGLEAAYPLSEHFQLGLQYRRLFLDGQDMDLWGGRLSWTF